MYDTNIRTDKPFIPGQGETGTQIDILVIEKIALIKTVELFKYRSRKKHEHACNPVRARNRMRIGPDGGLSAGDLLHELPRSGKSALTVFPLAGVVDHTWRDYPDIWLTREFQKSRKGVHGQADVRVEDAKKITFSEFECGVMVGTKSLRNIIIDNLNWKIIPGINSPCLFNINR